MLSYGVWRGQNLSGDTLDVERMPDKSWNLSLNGRSLINYRTLNEARQFSQLSTKDCIRAAKSFKDLSLDERMAETRVYLWQKYWREDEPSKY